MGDAHPDSLEKRVDQLEMAIERLERLTARRLRSDDTRETIPDVSGFIPGATESVQASPETVALDEKLLRHEDRTRPSSTEIQAEIGRRRADTQTSKGWLDGFLSTENWLNKVGIGLLLLGLVFLFKYSVDQGWLTPTVRLLLGVVLGIGLIFFSSRIYGEQRHLSLVLFGGGISSFFVTGFAAFQVFSLVSHPVAYAFLIAVTVFTFLVSLKQDEPILSLVGVIGGFAAPFLLYTEAGTLAGLMIYSSLLIGGACAIYLFQGWRSLLWLTVFGGWCVLGFGLISSAPFSADSAAGDRMPMQLGILFAWTVFAVVPFYREILSDRDASSHPALFSGDHLLGLSEQQRLYRRQHLFVHFTITPLLILLFSTPIWSLPDLASGLIILAGALLYGGAALAQYRGEASKDFYPYHALAGVILFTISLAVMLDGRTLLFALTVEAVILHEIGLRFFGSETRFLAHLLSAVVLVGLIERLSTAFGGTLPFLNPDGLTALAVLAAGAFISIRSPSRTERFIYAGVVHVCLLALLYRDLIFLENSQGIVTIVWGAYAVILLVLGLIRNAALLRILGSVTLLVVVIKLLIVDLAALETIWRILLFMGFGGLFLLLSYFFKKLLAAEEDTE